MALRLMYLDGCSHEDIAASSSTSVSNGGTRISRIKQKLKDSLTCGANMELEELKLAWQHA